jgi:sigma-B regulation protein RsbU (phosphoserine phosphatase)
MATFQSSLRALSATPASLDEMASGLDRYTRANSMDGRRFTTAFVAQPRDSLRLRGSPAPSRRLAFYFHRWAYRGDRRLSREFGEARLLPLIAAVPQEPAAATLQRVMTEINTHVGFARQHDDITCMVLRVDA